jgi:UDP-2,4-diacetamido-2,4,6-trideoxy-beta-L-idose 2-epimerase
MEEPAESFNALLQALDAFPDHQVVLTYPNADNGGRAIIREIEQYAAARPQRVHALASLGFTRYLSAVEHAAAVVGNSSSGIIEVPSFGVPTVNIGERQAGRLAADSVLHCAPQAEVIGQALRTALSAAFREGCRSVQNPYGTGDACGKIVKILETHHGDFRKRFHDLR